MPTDSFSEALEQLDPASRALLDLSLRRGMRTEEIAEVLGAEPDSVAATRDDALSRVAEHVGMGAPEQRDEVRARLAELPAEEWLGGAHRNGAAAEVDAPAEAAAEPAPEPAGADLAARVAAAEAAAAAVGTEHRPEAAAAPAAEPQTPATATATERGGRRRALPILLLVLLAIGAIVAIALASGGGGGSQTSASRTPSAPAQSTSQPSRQPKQSKPAKPRTSKPKPAPGPAAGAAKLAALAGSRASGSARLVAGGKKIALRVTGLRPPGAGSYQVWVYTSVLDSQRIAKSRRVPLSVTASLPADWRRYRFVDVSFEPADGNPSHSGMSVARVRTATLR